MPTASCLPLQPKLYISADLEGACGIVSPRQCLWNGPERLAYQEAVEQLTREAAAVITGGVQGGVYRFTVNDAHMTMTNLSLSALEKAVRKSLKRSGLSEESLQQLHLTSGKPKPFAMMAGLDASYHGAILLGYHAKAGTAKGILCHSFHDQLTNIELNGISLGEGGINGLYALMAHGVPPLMASGDQAFCEEIQHLFPSIQTVVTKEGESFCCGTLYPSHTVIPQLQQQAKQCALTLKQPQPHSAQAADTLTEVKTGLRLVSAKESAGQQTASSATTAALLNTWVNPELLAQLSSPHFKLTLSFQTTLATDVACLLPGSERINGTTLSWWNCVTADQPSETSQAEGIRQVYQFLQSAYSMLAYQSTL